MSNFFDRMLGRNTSKGSGSTAKDRLQFVLVHDRINLPPEKLREMKEEILAVISKYVSVDRERVDIALEQRERNSKIIAEIPFARQPSEASKKHEEGITDTTDTQSESAQTTNSVDKDDAEKSDSDPENKAT